MNHLSTYRHLQALKSGDEKSFRWLYNQHHKVIYAFILRMLQLPSLAEEATADVFVQLWKKRAIIDPEKNISALLYKIAKDITYNYLKKIASTERLKTQYFLVYPSVDLNNGEQILIEKEKLQKLQKIIDSLPPKRLAVFKMRYYEGLDNPTIAEKLEISINTVKVHLAKARLYLKEQMLLQDDMLIFFLALGLLN